MILVHKQGELSSESILYLISDQSPLHQLLENVSTKLLASRRLEKYILINNFVDVKTQKGFLSGISGNLEHIISLNSIRTNAINSTSQPTITFLDLRNAFLVVSPWFNIRDASPGSISYIQLRF